MHESVVMFAESIGWAATIAVVASYFFADPRRLRVAQIVGSVLWLAYGTIIGSLPVVVANLLVFMAALWTTFRGDRLAAVKL